MFSPLAIGMILLGAPPQPVRVVDQTPAPIRRSISDRAVANTSRTTTTDRSPADTASTAEKESAPKRIPVQNVSRRLRRPAVRRAFIPTDAVPTESTSEAPIPDHVPTVDDDIDLGTDADYDSYVEGEKVDGCCHGSPCCCGGLPPTWLDWWIERCDMSQHIPYFPTEHGYYYFRPYNHQHVAAQRDFVANWGGDPRNPYDNKIFAQVMADIRAEEKRNQPKAEPIPDPKKEEDE